TAASIRRTECFIPSCETERNLTPKDAEMLVPPQQRKVLFFAVPQPCLDVIHNVVRGAGMKILVALDRKDFGVIQGALCREKLGSVGCLCLTPFGA
ncbi:hypothetical protein DV515_00001906, partial [Chloebia gouldiae]